jgi:hypothetical protein
MSKHKSTSHNIITLLIAVAILVTGFATFAGQVSPAYADTPSPTPTLPPLVIPITGGNNVYNVIPYNGASEKVAVLQYTFINAYAQQLGVTTDKLQAAFRTAAGLTLDQAVQVGLLSDSQAKDAKGSLTDMYNYNMSILYLDQDPFPWQKYFLYMKYIIPQDLVSALHSDGLTVITELKEGKSAADIAKENNLNITDVQTAIVQKVANRINLSSSLGTLSIGQQNLAILRIKNSLTYILNQRLPAYFFKEKDDNNIDLDQR